MNARVLLARLISFLRGAGGRKTRRPAGSMRRSPAQDLVDAADEQAREVERAARELQEAVAQCRVYMESDLEPLTKQDMVRQMAANAASPEDIARTLGIGMEEVRMRLWRERSSGGGRNYRSAFIGRSTMKSLPFSSRLSTRISPP